MDEFDNLLHNIDGGTILRKRRHPAPNLDAIDPAFACSYDEAKHGERLKTELKISHLDDETQAAILALVRKYSSVFDYDGVNVPIKDYECIIDTGRHRPIQTKKIHYGPQETPIIRKWIAALVKLGHI